MRAAGSHAWAHDAAGRRARSLADSACPRRVRCGTCVPSCRRVRCAHVGCVRVRRLCGLPSGVGGVHEACWFPRCVGPRPVGWPCLVWGSRRVGRWHDGGHPPVVCLSALCACACVCRTRTCCMWCAAVCCMWCVRALSLERVPGWGEGHAMDVRPADCRERCVRVMQRMLCYVMLCCLRSSSS